MTLTEEIFKNLIYKLKHEDNNQIISQRKRELL